MKLSIFCILSDQQNLNNSTLTSFANLEQGAMEVEYIFATANVPADDLSKLTLGSFPNNKIYENIFETNGHAYNAMAEMAEGQYFTVINGGDTASKNLLKVLSRGMEKFPEYGTYMVCKDFPNGRHGAFRGFRPVEFDLEKVDEFYPIDLNEYYACYPYVLSGNIISLDAFKQGKINTNLGFEAERDFLLRYMLTEMKTVFLTRALIVCEEYEEHDIGRYLGLYTKQWYYNSIEEFWIPFFEEMKAKFGKIPTFIQYNFMYSLRARFTGNKDNKNKRIIEEDQVPAYFKLLGKALKYIDREIMLNAHEVRSCKLKSNLSLVVGILRDGMDFKFDLLEKDGLLQLGVAKTAIEPVYTLNTNIRFINYTGDALEIDGEVDPVLYHMADEVYFKYDGKKYPIEYNGRYGLTKIFGVAVSKRHPFHLSLPFKDKNKLTLKCVARFGDRKETISLSMRSHFSRVCRAFGSSHYIFGEKRDRMMVANENEIIITKVGLKDKLIKELKLLKDMLSKDNDSRKFAAFRVAFKLARPFVKRKPIWFYIDKIYKGGDSSEYLYKYALSQKDGNKHYYLIDKESADYARLKKEGYKPLVRGSIKHKFLFLYADMMVISNSTVFAFNGYDMNYSSFVRDLHDFHVCCVQHGMSVQKIAIAQNRLRDNTRLYFCASKYEIENLSKPVYDYQGYDALKLTGVPRYDGLVDRHKKQIMISPTWRMQAAMPVSSTESRARDYNPFFKDTDYYKVFNSLINDPRLLDAAKEHGYRIKYVLHPIVSSQVDDFDKNDFVDIVPAVGDMSYEDMFCESALMVTDFSGIQFDFAYMRKPVVYLHHKDIPQHYEEGTFHYDTMAFGEICRDNDELIDQLIEYMENDCVMKPEFVARADDFFHFDDHNNCERIYKEMVEYQNKYILKKK